MTAAVCPECGGNGFVYRSSKITCTNCGHSMGGRFNKYGAKRTEFNGKIYDSKYEASVASDLELRKKAKDIKDYHAQYKIVAVAYAEYGSEAFKVNHKVDFRIHHNDGSYELVEAKGVETADYRFRRKCLETLWLPIHKDHIYTVIKQR